MYRTLRLLSSVFMSLIYDIQDEEGDPHLINFNQIVLAPMRW